MTDLADAVPGLKRLIAIPGTFADLFPKTTEDELIATLTDGMAQAQLNGMLNDYTYTEDGLVTPDLTGAQVALVTMHGGLQLLRAHLLNLKIHRRYEATGGVTFEEDQSTNLLRDLLKDLSGRLKTVADAAAQSGAETAVYVADQYFQRLVGRYDEPTSWY